MTKSGLIGLALLLVLATPAMAMRAHHHHHRYSGQVRHPQSPVSITTVGRGLAGSPYCWPYDYAYDPYEYCGASYIVAW